MSNVFINKNRAPLQNLPPPNPAVRDFHRSLPHYAPTPLISLPSLAQELGIRHLLLKNETSRLGLPAFKILGASWATAKAVSKRLGLNQDGPAGLGLEVLAEKAQNAGLTLYAATEGNHGRAVARMAKYLGIKARIYVPSVSDEDVKGNIESEGAEVVVWDGDYDGAVLATKAGAERQEGERGLLISDTALVAGDEVVQWIVEGYQTMFKEIEEQILEMGISEREVTHVLSPVGVGSLCSGVVTHFGAPERGVRPEVVTVEPTVAACLKASLEKGEMSSVEVGYTICSGMCCGTPSASAWPLLRNGISMAVMVEDVDVEKAMFELQQYGVDAGYVTLRLNIWQVGGCPEYFTGLGTLSSQAHANHRSLTTSFTRPCGAATTAAVKQLPALGKDSIVILLCTEGVRRYNMKANE
jgi:diaminopropionate ammonia-lyase